MVVHGRTAEAKAALSIGAVGELLQSSACYSVEGNFVFSSCKRTAIGIPLGHSLAEGRLSCRRGHSFKTGYAFQSKRQSGEQSRTFNTECTVAILRADL